ncbi:MAG: M10 family metallopeptidase C-terminal domain-containing protein [Aestuariivirga sp.]
METLQTANPTGTTAINLGGNELNNVIRGNLGANTLRGNGGADSLYAGVDTVRDAFVYGAQGDSAIGAHDMIFNFTKQSIVGDPNSDKIDLRPIDADDDLADNQAFRFVTAFVAAVGNQAEGQVMVQALGADTKVLIDLNGDNTADMQIIVKAVTGLTAGDFWL